MEPPELDKAESCFSEVERIAGTAHSKASMAMMMYWSRHDPTRTLDKAQDAIQAAMNESDEMTLYQCLSLAGLAQIDLHDIDAASQTLTAIEEMVKRRSRIVVGDETLFLERLSAATDEAVPKRKIREIASTLSDYCRDADFAKRLKALAAS